MWKYRIIILVLILGFIVVLTSIGLKQNEQPKTIVVTDTITNIVYDSVYLDHYKTVLLPVHDTTLTTDTLNVVDSVFVDIPIYHYVFDTSFTTDTNSLQLGIRMTGYDVSLDTLTYLFKYCVQPKKESRIGLYAGPMVGVGLNGQVTFGGGIGIGWKL